MYHCHLHVYLLGRQCRIFEMIKEMPPLEHFTHEFLESSAVEEHLAKKADVIIAAPGGACDIQTVQELRRAAREDAEVIVLAERECAEAFWEISRGIQDLWLLPMLDSAEG